MTLFDTLKAAHADDWQNYVQHEFVRQMAEGTLPESCFQHYLKQDYLFLIHFSRAYGLAVYKADTLDDMRMAKDGLAAILDLELDLHVKYCAEWGIPERDLAALPEATATMAYTRYVLERGMAGTLLDLHVALAPCVVGYAEVADWMLQHPDLMTANNPYMPWIEMYSSDEYRAAATAARDWIDQQGPSLSGEQTAKLTKTFGEATRLEIGFWQMGLDLSI